MRATILKHGFTLVELLVVIAIVAVLVSLAVPTLGKSRIEARRVLCLGHLKQQNIGLTAYATEHAGSWPVVGGVYAEWMIAVSPYLGWTGTPAWNSMTRPSVYKKVPVFICPENQSHAPLAGAIAGDCYGRNMFLMAGDMTKFNRRNDTPGHYASWSADWAHRRTLYSIKNAPSRIALHFDSHLYETTGWSTLTSQASNRGHYGRANLAFVDGHAESLAQGQRTDLWLRDGSSNGWF